MDIAWFRDLVICVWGVVATLLLILVAVVISLVYRKVKVVLNYISMTSATVQRISSTVEDEITKPVAQVVAFIHGIRQGVSFITKSFKKE